MARALASRPTGKRAVEIAHRRGIHAVLRPAERRGVDLGEARGLDHRIAVLEVARDDVEEAEIGLGGEGREGLEELRLAVGLGATLRQARKRMAEELAVARARRAFWRLWMRKASKEPTKRTRPTSTARAQAMAAPTSQLRLKVMPTAAAMVQATQGHR